MLRPRIISCCLLLITVCAVGENRTRPRAREAGVQVGVIPPGPLNAITDVAGVLVGQTTVTGGENVRTGVTAILPHSGNLFREKVPGAVFVDKIELLIVPTSEAIEMLKTEAGETNAILHVTC